MVDFHKIIIEWRHTLVINIVPFWTVFFTLRIEVLQYIWVNFIIGFTNFRKYFVPMMRSYTNGS